MKSKKEIKLQNEKNISKLDIIYSETYRDISNKIIAKIDRIDLIDEVIIKVYKELYRQIETNTLPDNIDNTEYMLTIVKQILFEYYNNETPNNATFTIVEEIDSEPIDLENYNRSIIESFSKEDLEDAIKELDVLLQKALILYYVQKCTIKEIGLLLKCTEEDVTHILTKAIKLLEKYSTKPKGETNGKTNKHFKRKLHR